MIRIKANTKQIDDLIKRINRKQRDFTPVTRKLAGIMLDAVEENFEQEGRPVAWQPLSEERKEQRRRKGTWPGKILQDTGQMAAAVQPDYDNKSATVSNNKVYAPTQHFGRGGIPARPFMHLAFQDTLEMEDVLRVFLDNL